MPYADPAKAKEQKRRWRLLNPEKVKQGYSDWKQRNPGREKELALRWYKNHREIAIEYAKKQYANNPEAAKARASAYRKKYPEKCRNWDAKRRAMKKAGAVGNLAFIEKWERNWRKLISVTCYWCRNQFEPKRCHADHIIAIRLGGAHAIENMCISCQPCNCAKKAKSLSEWNQFLTEPVLL